MPPGPALAGLADAAWEQREGLSDDELIGVLQAWHRLSAWVAARELAAVAELAARRDAQAAAGADPRIAGHTGDEIAAALVMTVRGADRLMDLAREMGRLPATQAALEAGRIDRLRATVIAEETTGLDSQHAADVEAAVITRAPDLTSGQLRAATRRAALAADPAAASRRRTEALKRARVEVWDEPAGTAALAGRDLPPADVVAADRRIDTFARQLKHAGAGGTLASLRARVFTALLAGIPLPALYAEVCGPGDAGGCQPAAGSAAGPDGIRPPAGASAPPGRRPAVPAASRQGPGAAALVPADETGKSAGTPGAAPAARAPAGESAARLAGLLAEPAADQPAGDALVGRLPGATLAGSVNLTLPLSTWLGGSAPGEAAGYGPLPASDARTLARLLAASPASRMCLTLTGADGTAVGHGCIRASGRDGRASPSQPPGPAGHVPLLTFTIRPLGSGPCDHASQVTGYRPTDLVRHLVFTRQRRCSFPGCRRPAAACDLDHTLPWERGGRTCPCNLAPLCRRHHQAKQAQGWRLEQPRPGIMVWTLPSGRSYTTGPASYPDG